MRPPARIHYLLVALVTAISIVGVGILLDNSRRETGELIKQQFVSQQELAAAQTATVMEQNLNLLTRELGSLASTPAIQEINEEESLRMFARSFEFVKDYHVNDISRLDGRGIVRVTHRSPWLLGQDFSFRNYFRKLRDERSLLPAYEFITFQGVDTGKKGVVIALPVLNECGEFTGPIIFVVNISELIQRGVPPQTAQSRAWVLDDDGIILFHPEHASGTPVSSLPDRDISFAVFVEALTGQEPRTGTYRAPDGHTYIAAAHPIQIGTKTWSLILETPGGAIGKVLWKSSIEHLFGTGAALAAILLTAVGLIYVLNRSNLKLTREIAIRRRAEDELRVKEESYRSLVDHSPS